MGADPVGRAVTRPHTPWGDLMEAVRLHLWQGRTPPSADRRPWTMAREGNIAKRLIAAGWTAEELTKACAHVRAIRPDWQGESLSLRVFYAQRRGPSGELEWCATPLLEQCVGLARKRERPPPQGLMPFTIRMGERT